MAAGLLGFVLSNATVLAHVRGQGGVAIGWGTLAMLLLLPLVVFAATRLLRVLIDRALLAIFFFGGAIVLMSGVAAFWRATAVTVPVPLAALVAVLLLAGSVIGHRLQRGTLADPVVDPVDSHDRYDTPRPAWQRRLSRLGQEWIFVLSAVAVGALTWLIG